MVYHDLSRSHCSVWSRVSWGLVCRCSACFKCPLWQDLDSPNTNPMSVTLCHIRQLPSPVMDWLHTWVTYHALSSLWLTSYSFASYTWSYQKSLPTPNKMDYTIIKLVQSLLCHCTVHIRKWYASSLIMHGMNASVLPVHGKLLVSWCYVHVYILHCKPFRSDCRWSQWVVLTFSLVFL